MNGLDRIGNNMHAFLREKKKNSSCSIITWVSTADPSKNSTHPILPCGHVRAVDSSDIIFVEPLDELARELLILGRITDH